MSKCKNGFAKEAKEALKQEAETASGETWDTRQ